MGRLDKGIVTNDGMVDIDEDGLAVDDEFMADIHPEVVAKSARRRLEDLIEDRSLQRQLGDYNFDI